MCRILKTPSSQETFSLLDHKRHFLTDYQHFFLIPPPYKHILSVLYQHTHQGKALVISLWENSTFVKRKLFNFFKKELEQLFDFVDLFSLNECFIYERFVNHRCGFAQPSLLSFISSSKALLVCMSSLVLFYNTCVLSWVLYIQIISYTY